MNYKEIPNYPNYLINEHGDVYSEKVKRNIKQFIVSGYKRVMISNIGGSKYILVHRLVAQVFIENASDKPVVNHIDGDKLNNHYLNLEWCTQSENIMHARKLKGNYGGRKKGHKLSEATKEKMSKRKIGKSHPKYKGLICTPYGKFESTYEAERHIPLTRYAIQYRCKNSSYPDWYIEK